jgi:hypothetical protein
MDVLARQQRAEAEAALCSSTQANVYCLFSQDYESATYDVQFTNLAAHFSASARFVCVASADQVGEEAVSDFCWRKCSPLPMPKPSLVSDAVHPCQVPQGHPVVLFMYFNPGRVEYDSIKDRLEALRVRAQRTVVVSFRKGANATVTDLSKVRAKLPAQLAAVVELAFEHKPSQPSHAPLVMDARTTQGLQAIDGVLDEAFQIRRRRAKAAEAAEAVRKLHEEHRGGRWWPTLPRYGRA